MTKLLEKAMQPKVLPSALPGVLFMVLSGLGTMLYGLFHLVTSLTIFIEPGLTPALIGGAPEQIEIANPRLYGYITHIEVASSGSLIALGLTLAALAWFGIRTCQKWAFWSAAAAQVIILAIALPLHFVYGFTPLAHLGPVYLDIAIVLIGIVLSFRALYS